MKNENYFEQTGQVEIKKLDLDACSDAVRSNEVRPDISKYFGCGFIRLDFPLETYENITKAMIRGLKTQCYSNNWRKMHGVPMIRRRRKRWLKLRAETKLIISRFLAQETES